jgi:hypothetical protein
MHVQEDNLQLLFSSKFYFFLFSKIYKIIFTFQSHKLYIVGGRDGPKSLSTVECYDLITDTWTLCPRMITNRHGLQTAFINSYLIF